MNKAKAIAVVSALMNLDYEPTISRSDTGEYSVNVVSNTSGVLVNTLKTFQDANGIVGTVKSVEFT